MSSNIVRNCFLFYNKSALLQRCNVLRIVQNTRSRWNTVSKDQSTTLEVDEDDTNDQPIKYSTSKAAHMRVDEYREPDKYPWYQGIVISLSLAVFLVYFCILREENDIDIILDTDLNVTLQKTKSNLERKNT